MASPIQAQPLRLQTIGPYKLQCVLAEGGMGLVYLAIHQTTQTQVALKIAKTSQENYIKGLEREIRVLSTLEHSGVVRLIETGVQDAMPWFTMALLRGEPLYNLKERYFKSTKVDNCNLAAGGNLQEVLAISRQLTLTLSYLHKQGIVHRDLKPTNILIGADLHPTIVDFGLSCKIQNPTVEIPHEQPTEAGTVAYMAPESLLGESYGKQVDFYALGCILYEMVTGRLPFDGTTLQEIKEGHLKHPPPRASAWMSGVPIALDQLIQKLLEKRPEDRLSDPQEIQTILAQLEVEGVRSSAVSQTRENKNYLEQAANDCNSIRASQQSSNTIVWGDIKKFLPATRTLLEGAVVLGRDGTFALTAALVDLQKSEQAHVFQELLQAGILKEFEEDLILSEELCEIQIKKISPTRWVELHLRAGELLEEKGTLHPRRLADYFITGKSYAKAITYLEQAAQAARQNSSYQEAIDCYQQAQELDRRASQLEPSSWEKTLACGVQEGSTEIFQGASNKSLSLLRLAAALRRARWARQRSEAAFYLGSQEDSLHQALLALELLGSPSPQDTKGWVLNLMKFLKNQAFHQPNNPKYASTYQLKQAIHTEVSRLWHHLSENLHHGDGWLSQLIGLPPV